MRGTGVCVLLLLLAARAECAFERLGVSPLSRGTAGSPAHPLSSPWSALDNPAAAAAITDPWILAAISPSPFGLQELSCVRLGLIIPLSPGSFSFDLSSSGFSLYRESALSAGWALRIADNLEAGVRTTLFGLSIAEYGAGYAMGVDLGACFRPAPMISIGAAAGRINAPPLARFHDRIPTIMSIGCAATPMPWSELSIELRQEGEAPAETRFGFAIRLHDAVSLQIGITNNPSEISCGADLSVTPLLVSYRLSVHPVLGMTHTIGIGFRPGV